MKNMLHLDQVNEICVEIRKNQSLLLRAMENWRKLLWRGFVAIELLLVISCMANNNKYSSNGYIQKAKVVLKKNIYVNTNESGKDGDMLQGTISDVMFPRSIKRITVLEEGQEITIENIKTRKRAFQSGSYVVITCRSVSRENIVFEFVAGVDGKIYEPILPW